MTVSEKRDEWPEKTDAETLSREYRGASRKRSLQTLSWMCGKESTTQIAKDNKNVTEFK